MSHTRKGQVLKNSLPKLDFSQSISWLPASSYARSGKRKTLWTTQYNLNQIIRMWTPMIEESDPTQLENGTRMQSQLLLNKASHGMQQNCGMLLLQAIKLPILSDWQKLKLKNIAKCYQSNTNSRIPNGLDKMGPTNDLDGGCRSF